MEASADFDFEAFEGVSDVMINLVPHVLIQRKCSVGVAAMSIVQTCFGWRIYAFGIHVSWEGALSALGILHQTYYYT